LRKRWKLKENWTRAEKDWRTKEKAQGLREHQDCERLSECGLETARVGN
jgi:hypothetical protein